MREIKINITKARISSFQVTLDKEYPRVSATIELLTAGGKTITSYSVSSDHWQKEMKFDLPAEMVFPIREIADRLEAIAREHCETSIMRLAAPTDIIEPVPLAGGEEVPF